MDDGERGPERVHGRGRFSRCLASVPVPLS
jgi:hypothetical protein